MANNTKHPNDRKSVTIKVKMTRMDMTRLIARAAQFTGGNVSAFVRHAIDNVRFRPKNK